MSSLHSVHAGYTEREVLTSTDFVPLPGWILSMPELSKAFWEMETIGFIYFFLHVEVVHTSQKQRRGPGSQWSSKKPLDLRANVNRLLE